MTTHDFRPGDVVEWREFPGDGCCYARIGEVQRVTDGRVHIRDSSVDLTGVRVTLVSHGIPPEGNPKLCRECYGLGGDEVRGGPGQCERCKRHGKHPSRERAMLSLGAAREALEDAIDHLIKAGQPGTVPGQREVRTRTAAEGAQQCIHHATMALYWLLHERLGS